jgi:hypothetical protein
MDWGGRQLLQAEALTLKMRRAAASHLPSAFRREPHGASPYRAARVEAVQPSPTQAVASTFPRFSGLFFFCGSPCANLLNTIV